MKLLEPPNLDASSLLSILERAGEAERDRVPSERLRALMSWKEALLRRQELGRRIERQRGEIATGPATGAQPADDQLGSTTSRGRGDRESRPEFESASVHIEELPEVRPLPSGTDLNSLDLAREVAQVGSSVPEFSYYGRFRRFLSRMVARVVLHLAGIVTAHQRIFNTSLLDLVSGIGTAVSELGAATRRLVERTDRLNTGLRAVAAVLDQTARDAAGEQARLLAEIDQLRTELSTAQGRLGVSIARIEDQLRDQSLSQDHGLADARCHLTWLQLAEVEHREDIRRVEGLLSHLGQISETEKPDS